MKIKLLKQHLNRPYKKLFSLFFTLVLFTSVLCYAGQVKDPCSQITIETLQSNIYLPDAEIVSKKSMPNGLCEVVAKQKHSLIPLYATQEFVILGEMFAKTKSVLEASISTLKKDMFVSTYRNFLDECAVVEKTDSKRQKTLYMITDPNCPYCKGIEKEIEQICDTFNMNLKIVFYSKDMKTCVKAACSNLTVSQYVSRSWVDLGKVDVLPYLKEGEDVNSSAIGF